MITSSIGSNIIMMNSNLGTEGIDLQIIPFEANASKYIDQLVQLDAICFDESEAWTADNFILDLPQKGQLSKLAISNNKLVGYLICSSYLNQKRCHIHRMAVHPDYRRLGSLPKSVSTRGSVELLSRHRITGIAQKLWEESSEECVKLGIGRITVETLNSNVPINNLYTKLGFQPLKGVELKNYLSQKGKEERISRFSDDIEGSGAYFIETKKLLRRLST